jgi:hypothetical protein
MKNAWTLIICCLLVLGVARYVHQHANDENVQSPIVPAASYRVGNARVIVDESLERLHSAVQAKDVNPGDVAQEAVNVAHAVSYARQQGVSQPTLNYLIAQAVDDVVYASSIGIECGCVNELTSQRH